MNSAAATTLAEQLRDLKARLAQEIPADASRIMQEQADELAHSGITRRSLGVGDQAPDFELPDDLGRPVRLGELLDAGPVVLCFYRGGWCPYCNLELRALQRALPEIQTLGATLLAVAPETPDHVAATKQRNELQFAILSDRGTTVARRFGLMFRVPEVLRPLYEKVGIDIPGYNGDDSFKLPLPATYVIERTGIITFAFVNTDYTQRAEPADVLAALRKLGH